NRAVTGEGGGVAHHLHVPSADEALRAPLHPAPVAVDEDRVLGSGERRAAPRGGGSGGLRGPGGGGRSGRRGALGRRGWGGCRGRRVRGAEEEHRNGPRNRAAQPSPDGRAWCAFPVPPELDAHSVVTRLSIRSNS